MPTLVLAARDHSSDRGLASAAEAAGWRVHDLAAVPEGLDPPVVVYVTTETALDAAGRLGLALLEPPLDLLARLPGGYLQRTVEFARFADLGRLTRRTFVKPADPLAKVFDAGLYASPADIRERRPIDPATPVLLSEPVEWVAEYRCFLFDGRCVAFSPYIQLGRANWKPWGQGGEKAQLPAAVGDLLRRLVADRTVSLPPAVVVDVGLIDERGWAVVEFNPVFCAGLLGADPAAVLPVLARACRPRAEVGADVRWVVDRTSRGEG